MLNRNGIDTQRVRALKSPNVL